MRYLSQDVVCALIRLARVLETKVDVDSSAELVALFWIGRGDFSREEHAAAIAEAGLAAFNLACDDVIGPT